MHEARITPAGRPPRIAGTVNEALLIGVPCVELVLIRHGQQAMPDASAARNELIDPPLSAIGRRQAALLGAALGGESFSAVYASGLRRAADTAVAVSGDPGAVRAVPELREIVPFGNLSDSDSLDPTIDFRADFLRTRRFDAFPHTEPSDALRARVRKAMDTIVAAHSGESIAVVSHGGVINAYLAELLDVRQDMFVTVAHASVSRVLLAEGRWAVHGLNGTAHLRCENPALVTY